MGGSVLSRLVVVSNRVMLPDISKKESAGGLAVAVLAALGRRGGIWYPSMCIAGTVIV